MLCSLVTSTDSSSVAGIIINNKHFTCGMKDRVGTDKDAEGLTKLFVHLGFYTNRYDNLKGKDFRKRLRVCDKSVLMLCACIHVEGKERLEER